ncbi:MAG: ISNCY family transposase [Ardenticatenaceae bacterium]|nr:ISNCY family transposase [Ardenticatenaceae bacterium]
MLSFQAKRELLMQVAPRYRDADASQKSRILDEFVAATGYARKYAIRLLANEAVPTPAPITRARARRSGGEVQEALRIAWATANCICAKRLVPFLAELVPALERHGHLQVSDETRAQLLAISPATADRLLRRYREGDTPRGLSTTKAGTLLKHQVPVRTFADWNDVTPGFLEADLVAHCGTSVEGSCLYTLVLTDVATGWTECLARLVRSREAVIEALERGRQLLPFALLGLDTDNGSEFLNNELRAYCEREQITFTRGRAYRKNDQCYVEQKNGSIVRQLVGYDRCEGERAYRQLTELYRAVRLYVNFFQPSMKLHTKRREGSPVRRTYAAAQTPFQRLQQAKILTTEQEERLTAISQALDPVRLRRQLHPLQDALWQHAVVTPSASEPARLAQDLVAPVAFRVQDCGLSDASTRASQRSNKDAAAQAESPEGRLKRKYHRTTKPQEPRWWRTRQDPFADVWDDVCQWLAARPERTAKSVLEELQQRYPDQFPDGQLRTLQRRVQGWRATTLLTFDTHWIEEELLRGQTLPRPLQAVEGVVIEMEAPEVRPASQLKKA